MKLFRYLKGVGQDSQKIIWPRPLVLVGYGVVVLTGTVLVALLLGSIDRWFAFFLEQIIL